MRNDNVLLSPREALSDYAHEAWSGWMRYMFSKMTANKDGTATMPKWAVERWSRQMEAVYSSLSEDEKESDRAEADKILSILDGGEENRHGRCQGWAYGF